MVELKPMPIAKDGPFQSPQTSEHHQSENHHAIENDENQDLRKMRPWQRTIFRQDICPVGLWAPQRK
jgi:hypothetical protein